MEIKRITRDVEKAIAGSVQRFAQSLGYSLSGWRERKQLRIVAIDAEGFVWVRVRRLSDNEAANAAAIFGVKTDD